MAQTDKQAQKQGVLPSQAIRAMVDAESIRASRKITDDQIQPASLDLRLGATAYRVRASFLAGSDNKVADRLPRFKMHAVDFYRIIIVLKPKGFWHAPTKWGLRTKDHAGRYFEEMTKTRRAPLTTSKKYFTTKKQIFTNSRLTHRGAIR